MTNPATAKTTRTVYVPLVLLREMLKLPPDLPDAQVDVLQQIVDKLDRRGILLAAGWLLNNGGITVAPAYLGYLDENPNSPIEAAFKRLYSSLTARQQALFYACGAFASQADFSREALMAVWGGEIFNDSMREGVEQDIAALVPALLDYEPATDRYTLPEALRQYAQQLLTQSGGKNAAHALHLQFYRQQLAESRPQNTPVLAAEIAQYHHAFMWAGAFAPDQVLDFALDLCEIAYPQHQPDIRKWLDNLLVVAKKMGDKWGNAAQMQALGEWGGRVNHFKPAREFYYRALLHHNMAGQALIFKALGDLSLKDNQPDAAQDFYYKALLLYEEAKFPLGQANLMAALGSLQIKNSASARDYYHKAYTIYQQLEYQQGCAHVLYLMGELSAREGDAAAAKINYEQALQRYEEIDFWVEQANVLLAIGQLQPAQGMEYFDRALALYEQAGHRFGMANVLRAQGNLALNQEMMGKAAIHFRQALELYQEVDAKAESAALYQLVAHLRLDQGDQREAVRLMLSAVTILEEMDQRLPLHEARQRFKSMRRKMDAAFPEVWAQVTKNAPLPDWLQSLPLELITALESPQKLFTALGERSTLDKLIPIPAPDKIGWLGEALTVCDHAIKKGMHGGVVHFHRATLFKEMAAVPGQNMGLQLEMALQAYESALVAQDDSPLDYARTQNRRVALLRDMAGLPGEDRPARLYQALEGFNDALNRQQNAPQEYAITQLNRANLLRELAGLKGERDQRGNRMYEALAAYDEVLVRLPEASLEHATAQTNRASLLQEIATLPGEDPKTRLLEAFHAAVTAINLATRLGDQALLRTSQRMMHNVRDAIIAATDRATFVAWWEQVVGGNLPEWLG